MPRPSSSRFVRLSQRDSLDLEHGVVADAKSGVSGAGKAPTAKTHYMYAADNLSAYGVFTHRHTGEFLEQTGIAGDPACLYAALAADSARDSLYDLRALSRAADARECRADLQAILRRSPMVRLYDPALPQIQYSVRTSYADIGFQLAPTGAARSSSAVSIIC